MPMSRSNISTNLPLESLTTTTIQRRRFYAQAIWELTTGYSLL